MVASLIITIRKIILMMMKKNKNQLHIMNLGHILNIKIYLIDLFNSLLKLKIEREKETMVMKVKVIKLLIIIFL